jgi:hypothetical protein
MPSLSLGAHSESSARRLIGEKNGIIERLLDMLASSKAASKVCREPELKQVTPQH